MVGFWPIGQDSAFKVASATRNHRLLDEASFKLPSTASRLLAGLCGWMCLFTYIFVLGVMIGARMISLGFKTMEGCESPATSIAGAIVEPN